MVFENLKREMRKNNLSETKIANGLNMSRQAFYNRISGKTEFTKREMLGIRNQFFATTTIEFLFGDEEIESTKAS